MRKSITLTLFLLLAVWAVAQQATPSTSTPDQNSAQSQSQPGAASQTPTAPGQSQAGTAADQDQATTAAAPDVIEGCLGGKDPNYTVTAKDGTTYQLKVPAGADISALAQHVGESIAVQGTVDKSDSASNSGTQTGSVAGSENAQGSSSATKSIHAMRIRRGTGTCPASGTSNPSSSTTTPPPTPKK